MSGIRARYLALVAVAIAGSAAPLRGQERQVGGVGITVWTDANYRGESATFRSNVPDLRAYRMSGKISSLRIGNGEYWEGCEQSNFRGRCQVYAGDERNLGGSSWNDRINSLRRVNYSGGDVTVQPRRGGGGVLTAPRLVLFTGTAMSGASREFSDSTSNTSVSAARSASLRGTWLACSQPNFRPPCRELSGEVPDLRAKGLRTILSARPRQ